MQWRDELLKRTSLTRESILGFVQVTLGMCSPSQIQQLDIIADRLASRGGLQCTVGNIPFEHLSLGDRGALNKCFMYWAKALRRTEGVGVPDVWLALKIQNGLTKIM